MRPETINATQGIAVALRAPALPGVGTSRAADLQRTAPAAAPDPEVPAKAARRRFTADDKRCILTLADACTVPGSLGALLRREGLYASNLTTWRRRRDAGTLSALTPQKRGRKVTGRDPLRLENTTLRKENERLTRRLRQAKLIINVQKKSRRSWGSHWRPPRQEAAIDGRRADRFLRCGHHACLRRARHSPFRLLPYPGTKTRAAGRSQEAPQLCAGLIRRRTAGRPRHSTLRPVCRPGAP
jgi:hypothetical protein